MIFNARKTLSLALILALLLTAFGTTAIAESVFCIEDDLNPYIGVIESDDLPETYTLDRNYNSVCIDLGEKQPVNTVVLADDDGLHKIHEIDLALYVSDDGASYTKIPDFDLSASGNELYLYNFSAEARFVKVHCTHDDSEGSGFTNALQSIIRAGYEAELPGNGSSAFAKLGAITVASEVTGEDLVAYLPYSTLPSKDLCDDMRDLRVVLNGEMLPYWLDVDGVYVRIPTVKAGETVELEIWGGNEKAVSLSDIDSVFEVTYGNRTITDVAKGNFQMNIAVCTAPNGDIIAIGDDDTQSNKLVMRRSIDGGRTWDKPVIIHKVRGRMADGGGFLVDHGRIWYFFHYAESAELVEGSVPLKVAVMTSDDNGESWSEPVIVATPHDYHVTYCDGVKTAAYDGEGPNIDYVQSYHFSGWDHANFKTSVIYSTDDGNSWQTSESNISYGVGNTFEGGVTEAAISVLSNGDLLLLARCQYADVTRLAQSISTDNGLTWQENATLSNITAANTMPAMKNYKDDILLLWAGNTASGGESYDRNPLTLAYTSDDAQTWQQKLDLWCGTSRGDSDDYQFKGTQPSLTFSEYAGSQDLIVTWWQYNRRNHTMLIEDFDNFLYKTKGAADDFESSSAKYDGWTPFRGVGTVEVSPDAAKDGLQSLKIEDTDGAPVRATRSVPQMWSGEISFDLNVQDASSGLYLELKTAQHTDLLNHDRIMIGIDASGNVQAWNFSTETYTALGQISFNEWHNLTLKFDVTTGEAKLYLDSALLGAVPVNMSNTDGVCFIQLCDGNDQAAGMIAYIDNFRAYEGVSLTIQ